MRSVPRRERHRHLRNAKDCACRYHSPTPQILDRLELLNQQLNYALPVGIISQAIITTDNYLGYSLSHYLFSGKRTAAFRSLDDMSLWIEKGSLRQLIVDMEALPISCIEALNQLRALIWQQSVSRFTYWYLIKPPLYPSLSVWPGVFLSCRDDKLWPQYAKPCYQPPNLAYRKALAALTG